MQFKTGFGEWAKKAELKKESGEGIISEVFESGKFKWCPNVMKASNIFTLSRHQDATELSILTDVAVAVNDGVVEFVSTKELPANSAMLIDIYKIFGKPLI